MLRFKGLSFPNNLKGHNVRIRSCLLPVTPEAVKPTSVSALLLAPVLALPTRLNGIDRHPVD